MPNILAEVKKKQEMGNIFKMHKQLRMFNNKNSRLFLMTLQTIKDNTTINKVDQ